MPYSERSSPFPYLYWHSELPTYYRMAPCVEVRVAYALLALKRRSKCRVIYHSSTSPSVVYSCLVVQLAGVLRSCLVKEFLSSSLLLFLEPLEQLVEMQEGWSLRESLQLVLRTLPLIQEPLGHVRRLRGKAFPPLPPMSGSKPLILVQAKIHSVRAKAAQIKQRFTLGFSLLTLFRIFSSRSKRPGSRGPRPRRRLWSWAAASSSFSPPHISKYFCRRARIGALLLRSSFSLRISSSCVSRSSSVYSSAGHKSVLLRPASEADYSPSVNGPNSERSSSPNMSSSHNASISVRAFAMKTLML